MALQLGTHTYVCNGGVCHAEGASVTVGKFCSIAGVLFYVFGDHRQRASTFPFMERLGWSEAGKSACTKGPPCVGNDVWIGDSVTVLSGVTIGDGAIVGCCSTVTKSVPPYAVVAGNPARIVKYRFPPAVVDRLLAGKWWDLPDETIRSRLVPHLNDIEAFLSELEAVRALEAASE